MAAISKEGVELWGGRQLSLPFTTPIRVALSRPIARTQDPASSKAAADAITASGKREGQLQGVLALVRKHPNSTSLELSVLSRYDRYTVARRLPELEAVCLVCKGNARECRIGKRLAVTWRAI